MYDLKKNILSDIKVDLTDEFDQNFTRKAFFDKPWPKRMRETRGSLMIQSGRGRRSIRGKITGNGVQWSSDTDYMGIHNKGGKIKITPQMRRFFWAKYYENAAGVTYSVKKRAAAGTKRNERLNAEATFWRNMALSRKDAIDIPQRQFLGNHKRVNEAVKGVVNRNIQEYLKRIDKLLHKR